MRSIKTLVKDIEELIVHGKETSAAAIDEVGKAMGEAIRRALDPVRSPPHLRLSNFGQPCARRLWYTINTPDDGEPLDSSARLKFLFGSLIEILLLFLAKEAGHTVEGEQDELDFYGIKGHRDAIVDGHLVDVKSASTLSFQKFEEGRLAEEDGFGYIPQLDAYLAASLDDPRLLDKRAASFLVMDKQLGKIVLDTHARSNVNYKEKVEATREMLSISEPPPRGFDDEKEGESGNRKLGKTCSYCDFKFTCWPGLRVFKYYRSPVFLTKVLREPKVPELPRKTLNFKVRHNSRPVHSPPEETK